MVLDSSSSGVRLGVSGLFILAAISLSPATAQVGTAPADRGAARSDSRFTPLIVAPQTMHYLHVTKGHGAEEWDAPITRDDPFVAGGVAGSLCPGTFTASWTSANFGGGSFVVQGGFAEGEIAAVSYQLDPDDFPIKIELLEAIFAQQAAAVPTTTKWSAFVWDGPPGGIQKMLVSSNGKDIPHLVLGPGTQGANIQVSIDPGDPEQVFVLNESGTGIVSIGYRIDDHNNQTQNPCFFAPPSNSNAFPTTDTNGVASQANNWLNALNCGPFGCGPGWKTYLQLPGNPGQLCTPSGDWNMRVTYSCSAATLIGACCLPTGSCSNNVDSESCGALGGTFQGSGSTCDGVSCPVPGTGACCNMAGTCDDGLSPSQCTASGGSYKGDNTLCSQVSCPPPSGACCLGTTCLTPSTPTQCSAVNGTYLGNGSTCTNSPCQNRACCMSDGSCEDLIPFKCTSQGGNVQAAGTSCATFECPEPIGACCIGEICFDNQTPSNCGQVGTWQGPDTVCDAESCVPPGICETATGDCCGPTGAPGCGDLICCEAICANDSFCCDFEWDAVCAEDAQANPDCGCPVACTPAGIVFSMPPSGTIDARQPSPVDSPFLQGIGSAAEPIVVKLDAPGGASADCWTLCETSDGGFGPNGIGAVADQGGDSYAVVLLRPITPNAVTKISYNGDGGGTSIVYTSHPANANGDAVAGAPDVLFVVNMLNGVAVPPHGIYSQDIDRSGAFGTPDILRLIDLLNGAGVYAAQNGTALPVDVGCE